MNHVSDSLRGVLAGCGMHDRTAGTVMVAGIGDGERSRESALNHQPTGEGGELRSMGMGKRTPGEPAPVNREEMRQHVRRGYGEPFLRLVADNVDMVPTRQRRGIARLSLVRT